MGDTYDVRATGDTVKAGDRLVAVQRWRTWDPDTCEYTSHTKRVPVTVHYVRRRGDYQVDTDGGSRYWVTERGTLRDIYFEGTVFVVREVARPAPASQGAS